MIAEKGKAVCVAGKTAKGNKQQTELYRQTFEGSKEIFREFIGLLLLRLVAGQAEPSNWRVFDEILRQFYSIESTNADQKVIGVLG